MDYFFLLGSHDRRWFLQLAGSVLGCAYICTWCPAANQLISMEGWQREEDNSINPSSSSGIVSSRLFAAYRRSLCSIQRGCIPGLAFASGLNYLEIKDADIMNLAALNEQRQFYQKAGIKTVVFLGSGKGEVEIGISTPPNNMNMEMSIQQVFSKIFIQKSLLKEEDCLIQLTPNHEKSHHSSSSSSLRSRSLSIGSHESLLFEAPASRYCEDNKAMTRAMLAVISSAPSSSSQPQQGYPPTAFMVYHRNNLDKSESSNNLGGGQRMIKAGIEILRRVSATRMEAQAQEQHRPTSYQLHHMISERKRREKLNDSFHALRLLLPPGSKKDKASVLADTKNYLNSLRAQIEELEERNQMLELMQFVEGEIGESDEKVEVRVIRASESASRASQFINLEVVVIVREECEMMNLVVRLLEWLKQREATHLVAMEARTAPQSTGAILRRVGVGLQLKASDWDEERFAEAMKRAVNDVM
ncbi:putative transcription factor bHLH041 [Zingiber officinale]|uniref:putative transcription factor bHLH041 n=1 Tax=Zingiber officinale TaxID=94328 RepID=UPI001C4BB6A0|nr:putative transcription factor bHLH041 [Zingiber officinale]